MNYRWTILAVGVAAQAALSAVQQGLPSLGPVLRDQFDLSLSGVGLILASVSWGIGATLLLWGALADRERAGTALGLQGTVMRVPSAVAGVGFGALVAASSWGVAFGVLTLMPVAGWLLLRPLVVEEEGRLRARTARFARAQPANLPAA